MYYSRYVLIHNHILYLIITLTLTIRLLHAQFKDGRPYR